MTLKTKVYSALWSAITLIALFTAWGSLVTIHAQTPHHCIRPGAVHQQPHDCGHSNDPRDWHGIGEKPTGNKLKSFDGFPCSCTVACIFNGAMGINRDSWKLVRDHGLFSKG